MTGQPLSYNVLKSILEYLPLEKRIELVKHCPKLRTADQNATLQLDRLLLNDIDLTIDNLQYMTHRTRHSDETKRTTLLIVKRGDEIVSWKNYKMEPRLLMQKISDYYFVNREVVKIRRLEMPYASPIAPRLPEGLKIECKELRVVGRGFSVFNQKVTDEQLSFIREIESFLTSDPLEKMFISVEEAPNPIFQQELVRNTKYLEIRKHSDYKSIVDGFSGLKCEHIHVKTDRSYFPKQDLVQLTRMWLETCPELGTRFTVTVWDRKYVLDVMDVMIEDCGAVPVKVSKEGLENNNYRHYVIIRMRSGYWLNVFGGLNKKRDEEEGESDWLLTMEVMEPGSSIRK